DERPGTSMYEVIDRLASAAAHFEHVSESTRRDKADLRTRLLHERVDRHRGPVKDVRDLANIGFEAAQPLQELPGPVLRNRRELFDANRSGALVQQNEVHERAADIDGEAKFVLRLHSSVDPLEGLKACIEGMPPF